MPNTEREEGLQERYLEFKRNKSMRTKQRLGLVGTPDGSMGQASKLTWQCNELNAERPP
jgi:hypothetical protein